MSIFFNKNIAHLRKLDGLKQADMVATIGFKQSTWGMYESGASTPALDDFIKISVFFGILESDLLHTEILESDVHELYNRYIQSQKQPFKIGNTPISKTFKSYFENEYQALVGSQNASSVTESVTNRVTNPPKKAHKGVSYSQENKIKSNLVLHEKGSNYTATANRTDTERIAELEGFLRKMKALFTTLDI